MPGPGKRVSTGKKKGGDDTGRRGGGGRTHQLVGEEQDRLEGELAMAQFEQVFERGAEQIDDHHIVVALLARPDHPRHARSTHQRLVDPRLVLQRTVLLFHRRFELDGHFLPCHLVNPVEN